MKDKIKIGIIGAGENTRKFHIPNFQKLDGVEVVSVCNRSKESGQKVADEFSIQKVFFAARCSHFVIKHCPL